MKESCIVSCDKTDYPTPLYGKETKKNMREGVPTFCPLEMSQMMQCSDQWTLYME